MRDIKFRAFNGGRIVKVDTIWWADGEINWVDTSKNYDFDEDLILMQYTGLKDINGVEIYEGDIIREDIEKGGPPIIVSVVWEDGAFYGKERTHNPEYIAKEFLNGKVIGNIYENPELLED